MQLISCDQLNNDLDSSLWPEFIDVRNESEQIEIGSIQKIFFSMRINRHLDYFKGHFPEQAVLPGVVQIHWAAKLAKLFWGLDDKHFVDSETDALKLKKVKFINPVLPGYTLDLELKHTLLAEPKAVPFQINFSYGGLIQAEAPQEDQQLRYSSGLLELPTFPKNPASQTFSISSPAA